MIKVNGIEVKPTIFPDKTSQVWKLTDRDVFTYEDVEIFWEFETESEVFQLCQLVTLLRRGFRNRSITLNCPYLPYARQDKAVTNKTTFARETFLDLLDYLRITRLKVFDAHSPIHPAKHTFKIQNESPEKAILTIANITGSTVIGFPDSGALDRYGHFLGEFPRVIGHKIRNQLTGYLEYESFEMSDGMIHMHPILIVDDICDGGMTFIKFAEWLRNSSFIDIHLYTSHGIYSKGVQVLRDAGIKRIFNHTGEVP
jgi:ribose-phosphate pyrophosphokinase